MLLVQEIVDLGHNLGEDARLGLVFSLVKYDSDPDLLFYYICRDEVLLKGIDDAVKLVVAKSELKTFQ